MNNIFFMLWLSDIADSIDVPLTLVAFFGPGFGIWAKLYFLDKAARESNEGIKRLLRYANIGIVAGVISAAILIVIPSQNTMRMYIAAQAGQEILKTPTGSKAMSALDAVLDKITKEASK